MVYRLRPDPVAQDVSEPFLWSALLTALAFLVVGGMKARFTDQSWWRSAVETLTIGGLCGRTGLRRGGAAPGFGLNRSPTQGPVAEIVGYRS